MRYRNWALACSVFALMLSVAARADINSSRLGDGTGQDWSSPMSMQGEDNHNWLSTELYIENAFR